MSETGPAEVTVSAVIKAKNEADQIEACIESAQLLADEVIVVDDDSSDGTGELAAAKGATVISSKSSAGRIDELDRLGFIAAQGDWILRLDADERLTPALADELRAQAVSGRVSAVRFARKNHIFGEWVRFGGWFRPYEQRFFRADRWNRAWEADPHTQVPVDGPVVTLPARPDLATLHFDYDTVEEFVHRTILGYARTEAGVLHERGERFRVSMVLWRPARRFMGRFFLRQGFRDGRRGLVVAALLACYDVTRAAMLWDLERREGTSE